MYHKMSGFNINLLTYKYCLDNSIKVDWIKPKKPISSEILLAKNKTFTLETNTSTTQY